MPMLVPLTSGRARPAIHDALSEFKHCPLYLNAKKRQQTRANGVLSGNGRSLGATLRPTDTRILGRYRDLHLKPRPRVHQCHNPPVFQHLGPSGRLEFASSHPMYVHR